MRIKTCPNALKPICHRASLRENFYFYVKIRNAPFSEKEMKIFKTHFLRYYFVYYNV